MATTDLPGSEGLTSSAEHAGPVRRSGCYGSRHLAGRGYGQAHLGGRRAAGPVLARSSGRRNRGRHNTGHRSRDRRSMGRHSTGHRSKDRHSRGLRSTGRRNTDRRGSPVVAAVQEELVRFHRPPKRIRPEELRTQRVEAFGLRAAQGNVRTPTVPSSRSFRTCFADERDTGAQRTCSSPLKPPRKRQHAPRRSAISRIQ